MALIQKVGNGGEYSAADELLGTGTTLGLTLPAPPPGFAYRISKIFGVMRGGTSTAIRLRFQSSTVAGSPDPVSMDRRLVEDVRTAAQGKIDWDAGQGGLCSGNGHQVDLTLTGNVADSVDATLWCLFRFIAV